MRRVILVIAACVLFSAPGLFAQGKQLFKGQIKLCTCPGPDEHAGMPGKDASVARCPPPCATPGSRYVLANLKNNSAFEFDRQDLPRAFADQTVFVIGTMDAPGAAIHVNTILPDLPPQIKRAKTVAVVCDACPRAMAKSKAAAFQELISWDRFTPASDPKSADLIFLLSANHYLGDYLTRDGPDKRPVHVATVYLDILDPRTGKSLWGDAERGGSFLVGTSTRDLIDELREWMEAEDHPDQRKLFLERHWIFKTATDTGK
jgi:hypothetical protein